MLLIIGGKYQGKRDYAVNELKTATENIVGDFNENVRKIVFEGGDPSEYLERILEEKPEACVLYDEVGCGIIPLDPKEREYRIAAGRLACVLSEKAEQVYRVVAGLGIRLK